MAAGASVKDIGTNVRHEMFPWNVNDIEENGLLIGQYPCLYFVPHSSHNIAIDEVDLAWFKCERGLLCACTWEYKPLSNIYAYIRSYLTHEYVETSPLHFSFRLFNKNQDVWTYRI